MNADINSKCIDAGSSTKTKTANSTPSTDDFQNFEKLWLLYTTHEKRYTLGGQPAKIEGLVQEIVSKPAD
jgi:hypothetical protein